MKWAISTAIDSIIANSFLSRMHISMGKSIIIIEKERLIRERSSQEKVLLFFLTVWSGFVLFAIITEISPN